MAPFKRLPKTESDAKKSGLVPLTDFFKKKAKRGRKPKKSASKAGRPAFLKAPTEIVQRTAPSRESSVSKKPQLKRKKTRLNWSKGDGLKRMAEAVSQWEDELKKPEAKRMSMTFFADKHEIPLPTFSKHVTILEGKRVKVGSGQGRKPIIDKSSQEFITDVLVRRDRGNQGLGVAGAVDILETILPRFSREQLQNSFRRTVRPSVKKRLTGPVTVQSTTTKRSAITVAQQWRWHKVTFIVCFRFAWTSECILMHSVSTAYTGSSRIATPQVLQVVSSFEKS
jgi:hypothetical protein